MSTGQVNVTFRMPTKGTQLPKWKRQRMEHQQYRLVGNHSAVKICYWCKKSMKDEGHCYKFDFYGIDSEKCLEMSPAITCNQRCKHCWRDTSVFSKDWVGPVDDPKDIVDGCLSGRTNLMIGFKGNDKVKPEMFEDAVVPNHAAISLTGEPCMYPLLPELVQEFFNRNFKTVFLVTSGTVPSCLEKFKTMTPPTNIYLSLEATNKEQYKTLCVPVIDNAWEKVNESIDILRELKGRCRRVIRITLMKGLNMDDMEGFAKLIERVDPDVVETKGYMFMGYSRKRLEQENSPSHDEVKAFAEKLAARIGFDITDEVAKSTICMLTRPGYAEDYPNP